MNKWLNIVLFYFFAANTFGQLATSTAMSPQALVQNVLLGAGVQVSNITYTGDIQAIGSFNYTGANLGLNNGILITTGTVFPSPDGPHGPNDAAGAGIDNSGGSYPILNNLVSPNQTHNAAVLQFDFTAVGDNISFNYVFGSEEYLEFVEQGFNDVFGLFISGPNPGGGNFVNQNIAKLPNQTVVSIDNVNDQTNSAYYVINGTGTNAPFNQNPAFIQYDGYTKVLTASSPVVCGETYHLIIAIADVGDGIYDSGIFLEAQSLESEAPVTISYSNDNSLLADPTQLAEGCYTTTFSINRTETNLPLSIPVNVSGVAQNGTDVTTAIPATVNFVAGQSQASFSFDAVFDNINEPNEDLIISFQIPNACGELETITYPFTIVNYTPLLISIPPDTITCNQAEAILVPTVSGGFQPYTYNWSTSETTEQVTVHPTTTTSYTLSVTETCRNETQTGTVQIVVEDLLPINILPIADFSVLCPYSPFTINANASGGNSVLSYVWEVNDAPVSTTSSLDYESASTVDITLTVSDLCGVFATEDVTVTILTPLLIPEISVPDTICPGDSLEISASATSGLGNYTYSWRHSNETTASIWVTPLETQTYTVDIGDGCQTYTLPISATVPVYQPLTTFSYSVNDQDINADVAFFNTTPNAQSYFWDLGNGTTSTIENPTTYYGDIGEYTVMLVVVDNIGCIDTAYRTVNIGSVLYIPNTFTPDGNRWNNDFQAESFNVSVLSMEIYNRWGELVFISYNDNRFKWDGTYKGKNCPDGTYTYRIKYKKPNGDEVVKTGHVNILR